jgi:hypothetical protein
MSALRWAVVHAPDDLAVSAWTAAAIAVDAPQPRLVPWVDVLNGTASFSDGELVHAERLTPTAPTRYGGSRDRYERFAAALGVFTDQLAADNARPTADAAATLLALDRKRCTDHLATAGVPVPEAGDGVVRQRFAEPCDATSEVHYGRVDTTLALVRTRSGYELRHTLHREFHRDPDDDHTFDEAGIVRELLARDDETYATGELPTVYLNNAQHRFRFAVIDGRVTHAAGRLADKPLAREYYGGRRREIDAYHQRFGAEAWHRLIGIAEQAATAFPALRAIGVDIAASQVQGPDLVYDIDPFGARLPAALGLPGTTGEGLEVAATMLRSWMTL